MSQPSQSSRGTLFSAAIDSTNLLAAWERVEENAGAPGVDGISIDVFGLGLEEELTLLQNALRDHTYRPQPLLRVPVTKPQGGIRALAIPTVRDRVVQTAVHRDAPGRVTAFSETGEDPSCPLRSGLPLLGNTFPAHPRYACPTYAKEEDRDRQR